MKLLWEQLQSELSAVFSSRCIVTLLGQLARLQASCVQAGEYAYRLSAWNAYGWSDYALSERCRTDAPSLPCPAKGLWQGGPQQQGQRAWLLRAAQALGVAALLSTAIRQAARRSKVVRSTLGRVRLPMLISLSRVFRS